METNEKITEIVIFFTFNAYFDLRRKNTDEIKTKTTIKSIIKYEEKSFRKNAILSYILLIWCLLNSFYLNKSIIFL